MSDFKNINIKELRKLISSYNNDENAIKLGRNYNSKSFPEILGESRKESVHSNFIAWILNNNESHLLGKFAIKKLLELLVSYSKSEQLKNYKKLFDSIIISDFDLDNIHIETERIIKNGRIDIYIEADIKYLNEEKKLRLIIENKVGAKEQDNQTTKYFNYYDNIIEDNDINLYVFLTPISSLDLIDLETPECSCKEYIQINYQSIVDSILEPALNEYITERTRFIIKEYLQSLSQPTLDKDEEQYKQGLIMALGSEEKDLLTKFWEKNQKIILATLYAISSDPDQEKDKKDSIDLALSYLSKNGKDKSLCSISYNGVLEVEKIKKSDIGFSTVKILEKHKLLNSATIKFIKHDKSCGHFLIKLKDDITEIETKYGRYRTTRKPEITYNNKNYYVARNWGITSVEKFISKMKNKFKGLEYEIHS